MSKTEIATKVRSQKSDSRKTFCINHRYMSKKALAEACGISVRQVARYLAPENVYKKRIEYQKRITQQMIEEGKSCEEVRNTLPISKRQYYYYKEKMEDGRFNKN